MTRCQENTLQPNPWSSTTPIPLSYSDCCFISLEFPLDRKSKDSNIPELNFWQFLFAAWLQAICWSLKRYCRPRWRVAQSWSTWRGDRIAQALPKGLPAVAKTGIRSLNAWIPIAMAVSSPCLWYKLPSMTLSCKWVLYNVQEYCSCVCSWRSTGGFCFWNLSLWMLCLSLSLPEYISPSKCYMLLRI